MSENDWWSCYGPFKRWFVCPSRPDAAEVLHFSFKKCDIPEYDYVYYLSDILDLQKSMVYNVLKGGGLDSITRCRTLVRVLQIHPPLLGIDAKYYPIERHLYWWKELGFPFNADSEGYPVTSEVVLYLRLQRTQVEESGKTKVWSQDDLGEATGLKKETIYRMEHDRNPLSLESMSRRALVASALGTLAGEQEATIFRLFGLDPQAYGVQVPAQDIILEVHSLPEHLTNEVLHGYQQRLCSFFTEYATGHVQNRVEEAREWLRRLKVLVPRAVTTAQHVTLLALQCRYHQLLSGIARDQGKREVVVFHVDQAIELAEQALTLPKPQAGEHALFTLTNELVAAALFWRADAYFELGDYQPSQMDIDRALNLLPAIQSNPLKVQMVSEAAVIHAYTARGEMERKLVLSYFDLATQLQGPSQCRQSSFALDAHGICSNTGLLYLRKAMALSAPQMRGTTAGSIHEQLQMAQTATPSKLLRQHTLIAVFLDLDACAAGDYQQAISFALEALEKSRETRSCPNRDRIAALYQQLLKTDSRGAPSCAYLGAKLHMWDYGMQ